MNSKDQGASRFFYGWWIVFVSGIGLFLCYSPIIVYTFGVFLKPVSQELNWSRTEISMALSLSLVVMCAAFPLVGRLVDRFGARKVVIPSALIFGLSLISFYLVSSSLVHFYAIYVVLGVVGGAVGTASFFGVISRWFDKKRGFAMGLSMIGVGLGSIVLPPLARTLITTVGWRGAYVVMGFTVLVVTIPVVFLFLKESPQTMGLLPDGEQTAHDLRNQNHQPEGVSCREALQSGAFWLMCGAFLLASASINGCLVHLVPMLTDRGASPQNAAFAASVLGSTTLLGRIGTGYLLDRFFASYVAIGFFGGAALGLLILWGGAAGVLAFAAAALVGLGNGAEGDIMAYQMSRYFGLKAFGEIYSYVLAMYTLGAVIGPLLMGFGFDNLGSYYAVLLLFVTATIAATLLMTRLGPYRVWDRVEPVAA